MGRPESVRWGRGMLSARSLGRNRRSVKSAGAAHAIAALVSAHTITRTGANSPTRNSCVRLWDSKTQGLVIIGAGLIGGSIWMAALRHHAFGRIVGVVRTV